MGFPEDSMRPSPEQAQERLDKIVGDPESAYFNLNGKASEEEHKNIVKRVDQLTEIAAGLRTWLDK